MSHKPFGPQPLSETISNEQTNTTLQGHDVEGPSPSSPPTTFTITINRASPPSPTITLIPTAHISHDSVRLVRETISSIKPDVVAVELCASRYKVITDPDAWRQTDIVKVVRSGRGPVLLAQLILGAIQKKLAEKLNIRPGAEMVEAIRVAQEYGCELLLIDREVGITLKRLWRSLKFRSMCRIVGELLSFSRIKEEITASQIEELKEDVAVSGVLAELADKFPEIKRALIEERDQYMAEMLRQSSAKNIVVVIGAGHAQGIKHEVNHEHSLDSLNQIPPPRLLNRLLAWSIPLAVIGVAAWGIFNGSGPDGHQERALQSIYIWSACTSICSAVGATLALAHPAAILTAAVVAPFTTLHPFLAAGMFSGLIQATIKKPLVADFDSVIEDIYTVKGWYRNRITRVILTLLLTNLFSTIGIFLGVAWLRWSATS